MPIIFYCFLTLDSWHLVKKGMLAITQWRLIILIHLAGLYNGAIFNSIARKALPKDWNQFFSSKKKLAWKSHLEKIWGTKFQVGEVTTGRANTLVGEGGGGEGEGPNLQVPPVPSTKGNPECSPSNMGCSRLGAIPTV